VSTGKARPGIDTTPTSEENDDDDDDDDDDDEDDDDEDEDEEDEDDDDDAPWKYCTKGVGSTVADMSTIFGRLARAVGSS
jgi:hypothetical protein